MPVDLPVRKMSRSHSGLYSILNEWGAVLTALCFAIALAGLITHTPRAARAGMTVAVYEAMLQSP